ncbi:hypothetical protein [Frondihabitans australicus]|uniref:Uncharacterized protein n=1 Tax=Frondihabitans australicus TaxID=386892 RepID=A0A495IFG3_9MICO|nr:hypothetical protein [Frondihabitans australicus]RKR74762.1 hypothetical protein C8E83_1891 [Frondihabitans australicus]
MPEATKCGSHEWWIDGATPPPASWAYVVEELTHPDHVREWGIAVGAFVARYRRLYTLGPTFREMFQELLPDTGGLPGDFPDELEPDQRAEAASRFRMHVANVWRHEGMIGWRDGHAHTLRTGTQFRAQVAARKAAIRATVVRNIETA